MPRSQRFVCAVLAACIAIAGCGGGDEQEASTPPSTPAAVNGARLTAADSEPGQWMSHGRTYDEQRFSPLDQITTANVKELGLAWFADLDTNRGQEATPIVVDGVLYVSTAWSKVKAYNAATGEPLWEYDPQVPGGWAVNACCDVVNRGVAVWEGKVFVGTLDGRLDRARCGHGQAGLGRQHRSIGPSRTRSPARRAWSKATCSSAMAAPNSACAATSRPTTPTQASWTGASTRCREIRPTASRIPSSKRPRKRGAANGGRSAAAARCGIRCPTIRSSICSTSASATARPGITRIAARARATISSSLRSSRSIRTTARTSGTTRSSPGETWDHTATQQIVLADLQIDGAKRRVVMQAPKNGFFYVLDAKTGQLISAKNFTDVSWATHIDMKTGRPVENPAARYNTDRQVLPIAAESERRAHVAFDVVQPADRVSSTFRSTCSNFVYGHDASVQAEAHGAPTSASISAATRRQTRRPPKRRSPARRAG